MKKILMAICGIFMASCSNNKINQYVNNTPKLDVQSFLSGKITGYGIVEDYHANITRRFNFSGIASWVGNTGRFDEKIVYSDGKEESRVWTLTKLSESSYEAMTPDVIGKAIISVAGNAMNWKYKMNIKVDDSTYEINFDDWMYLMPDGQLINRNYFKKFGFTVGELTLFMQKESS
jgi:hypothetical protein